ncbi:ABC transporter permease [Tessaracoccus caeni]|uniref:ABC transporter permease n=1 Tax=Tessaracoccus caeni TaxID=3031239 RepID=UPI0023D9ABAE|nr:ABC transporter permease [Tessaracoccus caeni]MDF1487926.1 ABC transporter permease [Tessaracoccus caeni]
MNIKDLGGAALRHDTARMAILLALGVVVFGALTPRTFLTGLNLQSLSFSIPEIGILALAMVIAMASGGIDLSVVAIANLSAISIALVGQWGIDYAVHPIFLTLIAVPVSILVGIACGLVNGILVSAVNIRPILTTLATGSLFAGLGIAITNGKALYSLPQPIADLGLATLAGVPVTLILFAVVGLAVWFVLDRTTFGHRALLFGTNETSARYTGFSISKIHLQTYAFAGALAGIAAIFIVARAASASAGFGGSYIMLAITIAVLGGTDPTGGRARVVGCLLATVLLQVVSNGFNLLQVNPYIYQIIQGLILATFVTMSVGRRRARAPRPAPTQKETTHA